MFSFAYPDKLFFLLLVLAVVVLFLWSRLLWNKKIKKLGGLSVLRRLMPEFSTQKRYVRLALAILAIVAMVFAWARPWGGVKNSDTTREGIEIVIAVDGSNSMLASATGEEGGIDRMRTSKLILENLINRLGNDKVGLIVYAGDAYTLIPVTNDYVSAKTFLNSIDPSLIPHQGTNIGAAIALSERSFSDRKDVGKAIILLTDADELENPEGVIEEVKRASKNGIQTNVIGIGSAPVTIPSQTEGLMKDDETGEVVRTALNEQLALGIAEEGKGIYVNAANADAVDELVKQLNKLQRVTLESSFMVSHEELYYPFVIFAIVLLIIDFLLTDKRNRLLHKLNLFNKKSSLILAGFVVLSGLVGGCKKGSITDESGVELDRDSLLTIYSTQKERNLILDGNDAFRTMAIERADSSYRAALDANPRSVVAHLNDGLTYLMQIMAGEEASEEGQLPDSIMGPLLDQSMAEFQAAASPKVEKGNVSSMAFYNLGNIFFTQKKFDEAITNYKEALRLNPDDEHARRNLRIAQLQKNENDNRQNQQDQQDQNQQQNQNQDQQDQNRENLNNNTSDQILDAAERKENIRRAQMQTQNAEPTEKSGRSSKRW